MKRSVAALVGLVLAALTMLAGAVTQAAPAAAHPYCGIRWGSLEKGVPRLMTLETGTLTNIRAGRHACFDRLVLDLDGDVGGHTVRYVRRIVLDGSGDSVTLRGGALLEIVATIPAQDDAGNRLYTPANRLEAVDVTGYRTFRQVAALGNFEAIEQVGLGVRARLPFRVFELDGPGTGSRLVLDVAHRW